MDLVVNDKYEIQAPRPENLVALFEDQWVSALPGLASGDVGCSADDRISGRWTSPGESTASRCSSWAPRGRALLHAPARGRRARDRDRGEHPLLRKCLLVKQLFDLDRVEFELGNFVPWVQETDETFDLVVAAGVLYHLSDPVPVLDAICRVTSKVYLWTHYVDLEAMPETDRRYKRWFVGVEEHEYAGPDLPAAPARLQEEPDERPEVHRRACTPARPGSRSRPSSTVFEANGFDVEVAHEMPDNRSGPWASFFARKRA